MDQDIVVRSAEFVCKHAVHVKINDEAIQAAVGKLTVEDVNAITGPKAFDADMHFVDGGVLTAQYLLVVDAINFCFWPDPELQYEHMSRGIKAAVLRDPYCISAERLSSITGPGVRELIGWKRELPQEEERARLLREVGSSLLTSFQGQAAHLVAAAHQSAVALMQLVACHFPGFRDHAVYRGRQVFLYKRAQIFVGDVYGAFQGTGLGAFHDIDKLTMFADYRVPVVLHVMGIMEYTPHLKSKIEAKQEIPAGSEEEVEIRAATVVAVERLRNALHARFQARAADLTHGLPASIQLDWWLWHEGERNRKQHPPPHHTLTIFY